MDTPVEWRCAYRGERAGDAAFEVDCEHRRVALRRAGLARIEARIDLAGRTDQAGEAIEHVQPRAREPTARRFLR